MPLTVPATRSPGKVRIDYLGLGAIRHSISARLTTIGFPADAPAAKALAVDFVEVLQDAFNIESFTVLGWAVLNGDNIQVASGPFDVDYIGTSDAGPVDPAYPSSSFALVGRGIPADLATVAGQAKMTLFTGSTYEVPVGVAHANASLFPDLAALIAALNTMDGIGADVYGQPVSWHSYVCPQFNAGVQRKHGA